MKTISAQLENYLINTAGKGTSRTELNIDAAIGLGIGWKPPEVFSLYLGAPSIVGWMYTIGFFGTWLIAGYIMIPDCFSFGNEHLLLALLLPVGAGAMFIYHVNKIFTEIQKEGSSILAELEEAADGTLQPDEIFLKALLRLKIAKDDMGFRELINSISPSSIKDEKLQKLAVKECGKIGTDRCDEKVGRIPPAPETVCLPKTATNIIAESTNRAPKTDRMAIASLIVSLMSIIVPLFISILLSILAILLGFVALRQIKKSETKLCGKGFAVTGIIIAMVILSIMMVSLLVI